MLSDHLHTSIMDCNRHPRESIREQVSLNASPLGIVYIKHELTSGACPGHGAHTHAEMDWTGKHQVTCTQEFEKSHLVDASSTLELAHVICVQAAVLVCTGEVERLHGIPCNGVAACLQGTQCITNLG